MRALALSLSGLMLLAIACAGDDDKEVTTSHVSPSEAETREPLQPTSTGTSDPDASTYPVQPTLPELTVDDFLTEMRAEGLHCSGPQPRDYTFQEWTCQATIQSTDLAVEYTRFVTVGSQDGQLPCGARATVFGWVFPWNPQGPDANGIALIAQRAQEFFGRFAAFSAASVGQEAVNFAETLPVDPNAPTELRASGIALIAAGGGTNWQLEVSAEGVSLCIFP